MLFHEFLREIIDQDLIQNGTSGFGIRDTGENSIESTVSINNGSIRACAAKVENENDFVEGGDA